MLFNYKVKDAQGKLVKGVVEARSDREAAILLREQGFLIIDIKTASGGFSLSAIVSFLNRIGFSEIVDFTRQLSTMVTAGLTLTEALSILREQTRNEMMAKVLEDILHEIEAGNTLASALEKYPDCFSRIYVSLVRAGEASGKLDQVLARLADNLEKEREFRGKIQGAMIYPLIIIIGMIAVFFIMMTMVIPKMTAIYKDFGVSLPFTTKLLIFISDFFVGFWWLIIIGTVGLIFAFNAWRKTEVGNRMLDSLLLSLPLLGNLRRETVLVELTRTLGLLVGAGLPILEALNIVSDSLESVIYREGLKEAAAQVEKGFPLGVPLGQNPIFPPILGQMTKVGEETGKLDETLLKISRYFETESEQLVKGLTTAIEPIIMVILGLGVGFLIFSIIMPMYQLTSAF